MGIAFLDGNAVFGIAVSVQHVPNPSAQQIISYFGVTGTQMIFGGGRGRMFNINGVLIGSDLSDLAASEATLLSYDDGIARTLTDCWGRNWSQVVFTGQYQPNPKGPLFFSGGWGLPYHAVFRGLL